jgi:hypothetical protein
MQSNDVIEIATPWSLSARDTVALPAPAVGRWRVVPG